MATKKKYTFISTLHAKNVERNAAEANRKLEALRLLMAEHGEALADAVEYQKRGADRKIKAVEAECEAWLNSTHAPAYLRADSMERARQSLGAVALDYYKKLGDEINIYFDASTRLDLKTDIAVEADGAWRVSDSFINAQLEAGRFTFPDEMVEDYEAFNSLRRAFLAFAGRGYWQLCRELADALGSDASEDYPLQDFCGMYEAEHDSRKMK